MHWFLALNPPITFRFKCNLFSKSIKAQQSYLFPPLLLLCLYLSMWPSTLLYQNVYNFLNMALFFFNMTLFKNSAVSEAFYYLSIRILQLLSFSALFISFYISFYILFISFLKCFLNPKTSICALLPNSHNLYFSFYSTALLSLLGFVCLCMVLFWFLVLVFFFFFSFFSPLGSESKGCLFRIFLFPMHNISGDQICRSLSFEGYYRIL